jgi:hypothetical protein
MGYEMLSGAGMPSPLGASVLLHRTLVCPAAEVGAGRPSVCTFLSADLPESNGSVAIVAGTFFGIFPNFSPKSTMDVALSLSDGVSTAVRPHRLLSGAR